jgi:hypothetical protein
MIIKNVKFTDDEKARCVRRELSLRQVNYPRWVREGKVRQEQADREIDIMQDILDDYEFRIKIMEERTE